ncbi:MAG: hypothetical protein Q4B80_03820 [Aerococcaceae bacterium]|nr:hypothetical protein [Aerococcaceae bacterium]
MSEIVPFPNNSEHFFRKAMNALSNQQFEQGEQLLHKSLEQGYDEAFFELVNVYVLFKKKSTLQALWDTYYPAEESRIETEPLLMAYAFSAPVLYDTTQALIMLYRLKDVALTRQWSALSIEHAIQKLNTLQSFEQKLDQSVQTQHVEQFVTQLNNTSPFTLLEHLKHLYTLPYEKGALFYEAVLAHPQITHYIKSDVLHYLLNLSLAQSVTVHWQNDLRTVPLNTLKPYTECAPFIAAVRAIRQHCERNDPHLYDILIQQLTLHTMVFYLDLDAVLAEAQDWLDYMTTGETSSELLQQAVQQAEIELQSLFEL